MEQWENDEAIQRLREYLGFPSVHPNPDYGDCVNFIKKQAEELELPCAVHELVPKKPVVVVTWEGSEPHLPSILFNSHMDVVPVYEEHWTHPPFSAHLSEDGFIYARGVQDMKSVGMLHLEAIRRLKTVGIRLRRTVHVSFVPDEEIGGDDGMRVFAASPAFQEMNVGFELDESAPCPEPDKVYSFYGERTVRSLKVTCRGVHSHGSFLPDDTASEKLHFVIGKFLEFRAEQKKLLGSSGNTLNLGEVTTVNLTMIEGGVQVNVIPDSLSASFDVRVTPNMPCDEFDSLVKSWCEEAGDGVTFEYIQKGEEIASTKLDSVPYWHALKHVLNESGIKIDPRICSGATDARWVRKQGIPALNLTPIVNSELGIHCHDEKLHVEEYKKGIVLMEKIMEAVSNVE